MDGGFFLSFFLGNFLLGLIISVVAFNILSNAINAG